MDSTRVSSPPSILVHDHNSNHGRRQSTTRSAGVQLSLRGPMPMSIPNARQDRPPPPLPPPRFIDDLTAGSDPGWAWGNDPSGGFGKAKGVSTAGSNFPKSWNREMDDRRRVHPPEAPQSFKRTSLSQAAGSPMEADRRHQELLRNQDEGYYSLSGPNTSAMSQQLHGERQLQQRNTENSSQTYDNKLLSKLGKPKTPPRNSTIGSVESSPTSSLPHHMTGRHPNQLRSLSFPHNASNGIYSNSAYSEDSPIKQEPSDYGGSPLSRPMSPGLTTSGTSGRNFHGWRSPTLDRRTPSSAVDSEQYPQYPQRFPSSTNVLRQQKSRRSTSGSLLSSYDESAASAMKSTASNASDRISPLKRESYDQGMFSETDSADSTFRMEDSVRQLQLDDRLPLNSTKPTIDSIPFYHPSSSHSLHTSRSRPGMKRKQSHSPPPDLSGAHAANAQLLAAAGMNAEPYRNTSQYPAQRLSPVHRFGQPQGSISSQSSAGRRNNSYASSAGLSVGSSITSLDQHSPGTISPPSEQQAQHYQHPDNQPTHYVSTLPMNQDPRNTRPQLQQQYPQAPLENPSDPSADQKPQISQSQRRNTGPNMQSNAYICSCCPKKPKKFETMQQLRGHESEKQYSCSFCTNRFKNKNEAERHQNSIHLRKQYWSCATLNGSYDNAFYPSTAVAPADNTPTPQPPPPPPNQIAPFDICGYCGDQFSNVPQPDWDARATHLTNQHKFGECNQSKKFFRADHFRQHLKHSHAGTSGKWTNKLEEACMKEEQNTTPQDTSQSPGAPVANMGMGPGIGQSNISQVNMNVDQHNGQNMGQDMSPPNMANMGQSHMDPHQQNMGQSDLSQHQTGMAQAAMAQQAQQIVQLDMSNIDPNIGLQQMGNMGPMGNMTTMGGRGMNMQGGQMRDDRIDEMPQEI